MEQSPRPSAGPERSASNPVSIDQEQPPPRSNEAGGAEHLSVDHQRPKKSDTMILIKKGMGTNNFYLETNLKMGEAFKQWTLFFGILAYSVFVQGPQGPGFLVDGDYIIFDFFLRRYHSQHLGREIKKDLCRWWAPTPPPSVSNLSENNR